MMDHSFLTPLNDVKGFSGNQNHPPADASYKNLLWENFQVPEILFHVYTPTIVSL